MVFGFGGKNKSKMGAFHPMALLDVVYTYRLERQIQKLTEYKPAPSLSECTTDLRKSTLLMFLAEVVSKSIREEAEDESQFKFIDTSIQILEQMDKGLQFFHIAFMVKLTRHLGFFPGPSSSEHLFFDLEQGHCTSFRPAHRHYISVDEFKRIEFFADCQYNDLGNVQMSKDERDFLLETILTWYGYRIPTMKDINSYGILREVFGQI